MTNEQPEQWAVELARDWNYECKRCSEYEGDFEADFAADLQRAFTERTADLVARDRRTLEDHGRMLWRDDVEGHCLNPDLCFEYSDTVRCGACAFKQSAAAGVEVRNPDKSYSPEVCRLKREKADLVADNAKLRRELRLLKGPTPDEVETFQQAFERGFTLPGDPPEWDEMLVQATAFLAQQDNPDAK